VNSPLTLHPQLFEEVRKYVFLPNAMKKEFGKPPKTGWTS